MHSERLEGALLTFSQGVRQRHRTWLPQQLLHPIEEFCLPLSVVLFLEFLVIFPQFLPLQDSGGQYGPDDWTLVTQKQKRIL